MSNESACTIMPIEEQTKIKHELLRSYLPVWMNVLYQFQEKKGRDTLLIFIDGFCGVGEYYIDEAKSSKIDGSPLIVAKIANDIISKNTKRKFYMICNDSKSENAKNVKNLLNKENKYEQKWIVKNGNFELVMPEIINEIPLKTYPMFIFIDPYGFSDYPMSLIKEILSNYERAELFINFMVYDINRFALEENRYDAMFRLYGDDSFLKLNNESDPRAREAFLLNQYCSNIKDYTNAEFIMPFRINTPKQQGRAKYFMIHVSKNYKALNEMKNAMHKVSESEYRFEAIGIRQDIQSLFEDPDRTNLREKLLIYIKSIKLILYKDIEEWAYINTNGVARTIKEALIDLERDKNIKIERLPRQQHNTVNGKAVISFLKDKNE